MKKYILISLILSFLLFTGCESDNSQKTSKSSPESDTISTTEGQHKFLFETEPAGTSRSENTDTSNRYYSENKDTVSTDYSDNVLFNRIRDSIGIGYTFKLGKYIPQTGSEDNSSILWRVIDKKDNDLLIVSEYILDAVSYNNYYSDDPTWSECSIRKWLNEDFYNTSFTSAEKNHIKNTALINNQVKKNEPETQDNIFLLSSDEVNRYFTNEAAKKCDATKYAKDNLKSYEDNSYSWLTRTSDSSGQIYVVSERGTLFNEYESTDNKRGLRPAMWINIGDKDSSDISGNSINMSFDIRECLIKDNIVLSHIDYDRYGYIDENHFAVFSEENSDTYFISLMIAASETINNFKVYRDNVMENKLIYTHDSIQNGTALILNLSFSDDNTAYTFSYTDKDNKEVMFHVFQSPIDGSIYMSETELFTYTQEYF